MAVHYKAVLGQDLFRILYADGWRSLTYRGGTIVVLWKDDQRPKQITLNIEISLKRVRAVCASAKITAVKFDELYRTAPLPTHQYGTHTATGDAANSKIH